MKINKRRRYRGMNKRSNTAHIRIFTVIFCLASVGGFGYIQLKNSKIFEKGIFRDISLENIFNKAEDEKEKEKENEEYVYDDVAKELEKEKETASENTDAQVATINGVTLYTIQVASLGEGQDLKSIEEKLKSSKIPYSVVEVDGVEKVQTYSSFNEEVTRSNLENVRKEFNDAFISELEVPILSLEYTSKYSYIENISKDLNLLIDNYKEETKFWESSKEKIDLKEYNNILTKRLEVVKNIQENANKIDYKEMNIFKENLIKYAKDVDSKINESSKSANEGNYDLSQSLLLSCVQGYYSFINSIKAI
ncbi:MAG: hypothetical protein ACRDD7_03275 [Peptostreptococcaceae bacterium]